MNNPESIFDNPMFNENGISIVNTFTGNDMTIDTMFFSPNQSSNYFTATNGDVCLFFFEGGGKCHLKNTSESIIEVTKGSIIYIPKGVSYKIENSNHPMITAQSSSAYTQ